MTEKEYRQREGISRSELWRLNPDNGGTPEKFMWAREHPEAPTPALIFGQATHKLLLEQEDFFTAFAVLPNIDKRTKEGKASYAAFLDGLCGRQELSLADYEKAVAMTEKTLNTDFVRRLLGGEHEKPIFWTDAVTGEVCKIRLDCLTEIGGVPLIVDYKTAQDASLDGFTRHALKYGYDFQAGMYCEGVEQATGKTPRFVFVVQEKDAPYAVNVIEADAAFIQRGKDKMRELLGIYHECKVTGKWYGYMGADTIISTMMLPSWACGNN